MGPKDAMKDPTYFDVCLGITKQVEVYQFEFNGDEETYNLLVKHFYSFHDPTTLNQQGNDSGSQYASMIYVFDEKQLQLAKKITLELQNVLDRNDFYESKEIVTEITPSTVFYPGPTDHQDYLNVNPDGYCNHYYRFKEWPVKTSS